MTLLKEASQANPARTIAVTHFTAPDLDIGPVQVAFSNCGPQFTQLLGQRLGSYNPPHFIPVDTAQPWPNNNVISGAIYNPTVMPRPGGSYSFAFPIYLESGQLGSDNEIVVDLHNLTATGTLSEPPADPDALFAALVPTFRAAFDKLVEAFANSPYFSNYMWGSSVVAVGDQEASSVTIAATSSQNIQPGNLFQVMQDRGSSGVFEPVALIQVASVTADSSLCTYFGGSNQKAVVGDLVSIYQTTATGKACSRFLGVRRISRLGRLPSSSSLPIELGLSMNFAEGADTAQMNLDPTNMVGPPQTGNSFLVQYISIFARVPEAQQVNFMINGGNAGGHWIELSPQGSYDGYSVYVGSQLVSFVIAPTGLRMVAAVRSASSGEGLVDVHLTGSFSS
jgi:hypothetical protein